MLMPRKIVNERLRISDSTSRRLFPGGAVINSERIVGHLNVWSMGMPRIEDDIVPAGMLSASELPEALSERGFLATKKDVQNWTKRIYPVPHYRVSKRILIFSLPYVEAWLCSSIRQKQRREWRIM